MHRLFISIILCLSCYVQSNESKNDSEVERTRRALVWPTGSSAGYIVAVVVPIDIVDSSVFFSYTFEANYGLPTQGSQFTSLWYDRLKNPPIQNGTRFPDPPPEQGKRSVNNNAFMNRRLLYLMFEDKLEMHGLPGHECLLRTICEANEIPLTENNGVLGDILHIILSPSTSTNEDLSSVYFDAESNGQLDDCSAYHVGCPKSVFDFLSVVFKH